MDYLRVKAYAKINLSLDILGVENGYHMLDSVAVTVDLYDLITLKKRKKSFEAAVYMHGLGSENIPPEENNALKAARLFIEKYNTCGVDIEIYKNIPIGAGLGGSSADVAGVLIAMKRAFDIDDEEGIKRIADSLGSDCGYMLYGGYARLLGRGEKVELIESKLPLNLLLVLPNTGVSTAKAYAAYDKIPIRRQKTSEQAYNAVIDGDEIALGKSLSNALLPAAYSLNTDIGVAVQELQAFAPLGVNMTGSGSCVYALFENDEFCRYAESRYRGKFTLKRVKTVFPNREKLWQKKD